MTQKNIDAMTGKHSRLRGVVLITQVCVFVCGCVCGGGMATAMRLGWSLSGFERRCFEGYASPGRCKAGLFSGTAVYNYFPGHCR